MSDLTVTLDTTALKAIADRFAEVGGKAPLALARAINHTGAKAKTKMIKVLVPQTGLKRKVIHKALRENKAGATGLTYTITARGGDIRLKYFKPRETRTGVSAAPWGRRAIYAHTFMKAGWFPHRVTKSNWNGQVYERAGSKTKTAHLTKGKGRMDRFEVVRSGLFIPDEMVQAESAAAFNETVASELPDRLERELAHLLRG